MIVSAPFAPLFEKPDFYSNQVDELLYGDELEVLEETKAFYKIKTDYSYYGWVLKEHITKKSFDSDFMVISNSADLLFQGKYGLRPAFNLPKGSKIKAILPNNQSKFAYVTFANRQIYYIHKNHISPITKSRKREDILNIALSYLGTQYRLGGRTNNGIDCSGLCFNSYRFNGIDIWRDSDIDKAFNVKIIPFEQIKVADLLYFKGHIAMYMGDGNIIHSSASKGSVVIEKLEENQKLKEIYICAGTVL